MAAINYDAIAQELKRGLVKPDSNIAMGLGPNKETVLRELFTLGMGGPRQTGKTKWIIESLIRDPNSRLIALNTTMREAIITQLSAYSSLDQNREGDKPQPDAIWHCGGIGWVPIHEEAAELIRNDPEVVEQAKCRIVAARTLRDLINKDETFPIGISQVFIDQRLQVCSLIRLAKYYTWLAKQSDEYTLTWLID